MFSPDGTLISASAAPHCGGTGRDRKDKGQGGKGRDGTRKEGTGRDRKGKGQEGKGREGKERVSDRK